MRKLVSALLSLCALILFAGCGASGGDDDATGTDGTSTTVGGDTTPDTEPDDTEPVDETTTTVAPSNGARDIDDWAADFCGSFQTWMGGIEASGGAVEQGMTPGDLESGKAAIVGLFSDVGGQTEDLIKELEDGGHPDVSDGDALVDELVDRFTQFHAAISAAHGEAQNISTSSPEEFQAQILDLVETFQEEVTVVGDSFAELDERFPDPELQSALLSCDL